MVEKKVNRTVLWVLLGIAVLDMLFIVLYKLDLFNPISDSYEIGVEMTSEVLLIFILIFVILYVPTGQLKKETEVKCVEVEPISASEIEKGRAEKERRDKKGVDEERSTENKGSVGGNTEMETLFTPVADDAEEGQNNVVDTRE